MVGPAFLTSTSLPAGLLFAVLGAVAVAMGLATWRQRDLWPFSHYPMFGKATEADAVRFYVLRFHLPEGQTRGLTGAGSVLADRFHREFLQGCDSGAITAAERDELVRRYWREASRLDRRLALASQVDVALRIARIVPGREVVLMTKVVHSVVGGAAGASA